MIESTSISYLDKIENVLIDYSESIDYVIKMTYPLDCSVFEKLLLIEKNKPEALNYMHVEFDEIDLSGRQVLNLSNNLNVNILVKNPSEKLVEEMLIGSHEMDLHKTVYPSKLIVLLTIYTLYYMTFNPHIDIFSDYNKFIADMVSKISYLYIKDKYSTEYLVTWTKWYLDYLAVKNPEFIQNFAQHCAYLFNYAVDYHEKPDGEQYIKEEVRVTGDSSYVKKVDSVELLSGIYLPLAFVMKDMLFNPYNFHIDCRKKYSYIKPKFGIHVILALWSISEFYIMADKYIRFSGEREKIYVESLDDLGATQIIDILKGNKVVVCNNNKSINNLFPIEVIPGNH